VETAEYNATEPCERSLIFKKGPARPQGRKEHGIGSSETERSRATEDAPPVAANRGVYLPTNPRVRHTITREEKHRVRTCEVGARLRGVFRLYSDY
jgi:hypothetical protein